VSMTTSYAVLRVLCADAAGNVLPFTVPSNTSVRLDNSIPTSTWKLVRPLPGGVDEVVVLEGTESGWTPPVPQDPANTPVVLFSSMTQTGGGICTASAFSWILRPQCSEESCIVTCQGYVLATQQSTSTIVLPLYFGTSVRVLTWGKLNQFVTVRRQRRCGGSSRKHEGVRGAVRLSDACCVAVDALARRNRLRRIWLRTPNPSRLPSTFWCMTMQCLLPLLLSR